MEKLKRGDKIFLDKDETEESAVNTYLDCRDGVVEVYEYVDSSGYGSDSRLFLCRNTKHEFVSIVRQTWNSFASRWIEEDMCFDSDDFEFLEALVKGKTDHIGGEYTLLRTY